MISIEELLRDNPFPGLRAFSENEADRFFGREQQIQELMAKLDEVPFIAVAGTSGCGKSSLVCAGLLNALAHRSASEGGTTWLPVVSLPGNQPTANLARQLSTVIGSGDDESMRWGMLYGQLQLGGLALSELIQLARLKPGTRLLVVIDQFEEIFRFKKLDKVGEASAFVKLLLNAANDRDVPLSIIITLRSEFLGACADFADLPEAINRGQYLLPKLTRGQRKVAISGPVELRGYQIAPRLVQRILNDVSENFDDLPVMQHALCRTWQRWAEVCQGSRPIDLEDYEAIGTTKEALARHADEAARSTGIEAVVERVFRALTQQLPDGTKIRRALDFKLLCAVVGGDPAQVERVVERFRRSDTTLLRPEQSVLLSSNPVIDISHESLINLWSRLREWVQAENESSAMLKKLIEASQNYEANKGSLWRGPELKSAIKWRKSTMMTLGWVGLYAGSNDAVASQAVKRFLDKSRHRSWLWNSASVLVLGAVALPLSMKTLINQRTAADLANAALLQTDIDPAFSAHLALAALERDPANDKAEYALRQSLVTLETAHAVKIISLGEPVADAKYSEDGKKLVAVSGKTVTILDALTFERTEISENEDMKQAWLMGKNNVLVTLSYDGHARRQKLDQTAALPLNCPGKKNFAWTVSTSSDDRHVAVGCYNGEVLVWDVTADATGPQYAFTHKVSFPVTVTSLGFSAEGGYLASGDADGEVNIWKMGNTHGAWLGKDSPGAKGRSPIAHQMKTAIRDVGFYRRDPNLLVTAGDDRQAIVWHLDLDHQRVAVDEGKNAEKWVLPHAREVKLAKFTTSNRSKGVPVFTLSGKTVQRWEDAKPDLRQTRAHDDTVTDMDASPDSELLATASADGTARIWSSRTSVPIAVLRGHTAQVNRARFSPKGNRLVTASEDGSVRIWQFSPSPELATLDRWVTGARFEPGAKTSDARVVVVGEDGYASVVKVNGAIVLKKMDKAVGTVGYPSWSRDKNYLLGYLAITGLSRQPWPILFDVESGREIITGCLKDMLFAAFSPGTDEFVTVSRRGRIAVWDIGMILETQPKPKYESGDHGWIGMAEMSPDGRWVAVVNDNKVELWKKADLKEVSQVLTGHRGFVRSLRFSHDSKWLVTASEDRTARIWSLENPGQSMELTGGHTTGVYSASFDPSGKYVATSGADGTIGVWSAESARLRATLHWHSEVVSSVEFGPDGQWILSASDDGTVKFGQCEACWLGLDQLKQRVPEYAKLAEKESKELSERINGTRRSIWPEWLTVWR